MGVPFDDQNLCSTSLKLQNNVAEINSQVVAKMATVDQCGQNPEWDVLVSFTEGVHIDCVPFEGVHIDCVLLMMLIYLCFLLQHSFAAMYVMTPKQSQLIEEGLLSQQCVPTVRRCTAWL